MIILVSLISILIVCLLVLISIKSESLNKEIYQDEKEQNQFDRDESVKQAEHNREIEKMVVEKHYEHLVDYAKIEEARRPHPLPPVIINIENFVTKKKA